MNKGTHFIGQPLYGQLINLLDKEKIAKISRKNGGERYIKKFDLWQHLSIMLYAVIKRYDSLREIAGRMLPEARKLAHLGISVMPKRSTLSDANARRPEGDNIPQCWVDMIAGGDRELAKKYLEEYTHKIGNLTITGYNSTLGNKSFEEKRDRRSKDGQRFIGYKNGLEINREIAEKETWSIEDIKTRTSNLVAQLLEMFKFPG